ncbi:MAG: aminopeptidase P family protein [Clostridia bacterium]|nr:aminopeptidase P family protein [Clostridia bacterium]
MIVSNPVNIKYLTGIDAEGTLLITRKENVFITDGRYIESVNRVLTIDDGIIVYDIRSIREEDFENFFLFCSAVGFEENYVTYAKYKEYIYKYKIENMQETENLIEQQRTIKDEEEIGKIRQACKITDDCFKHLTEFIKIGMTEKEVAAEIEYFFKTHGAEEVSFPPIVASGANSSMPHAIPTNKKIETGDTIIIDMGCKYEGYCSDMTRTIFMDYVPEEAKTVYDLVLNNQLSTLKEYVDGGNTKIISKLVENNFEFNRYMLIHALGHGVGLDIHETPVISSRTAQTLKENMVITDEPGIYLPGKFGVRIEDTVLITKNGAVTLTNSEKNYVILKSTAQKSK